MDTLVIKRLKNHFYRGWDDEEHIISFKVRLEKERKKLSELTPPITIADKELAQHYVEQMLKRANYFGQKCCTEFEELPAIQKQWPAPATHYKKRNEELENYEKLGGKRNPYASANSATELQDTIQAAVATGMASLRDENAQALTAKEEGMQEQINKLTSALALIAEEQANYQKQANKENTPPRRRKKRRYSSESEDSSSDDEPTPPPQPRKKKKKKPSKKGKREYEVGEKFKIGMEFDDNWTYKKGQQFLSARGNFWNTKILPALKHRRDFLKQTLKETREGTGKYKWLKKTLERVKEEIKEKKADE